MNQYFQLHKTSEAGRLVYDRNAPHVWSKKDCRKRVGDRIWLISREGQKAPYSYFLRYAFVADSVETDGVSHRLSGGTDVADFGPGVQLDFLPWFPEFKKAASNFSLGLSRIPEAFVRHFEALAAADATS